MNYIEAAEINVPRVLNNIEFMIGMSTKGIHLDCLGFEFERFNDTNGQKFEQKQFDDDMDRWTLKTDYIYKAQPKIFTLFRGQANSLMYCDTRFIGMIRGLKSNVISYDYRDKEWAIKVEDPNAHFTITHKVKPGDVYTDRIEDINDEGEMFQYSVLNTVIPDIVFDSARRMLKLINMSPNVDAMTLRTDAVIVDLEYRDLKEEFDRKQLGFCNF